MVDSRLVVSQGRIEHPLLCHFFPVDSRSKDESATMDYHSIQGNVNFNKRSVTETLDFLKCFTYYTLLFELRTHFVSIYFSHRLVS